MRAIVRVAALLAALSCASATKKPNFVFVFADDMRKDDMVALPRIRESIAARGRYAQAACCRTRAAAATSHATHTGTHVDGILFGLLCQDQQRCG